LPIKDDIALGRLAISVVAGHDHQKGDFTVGLLDLLFGKKATTGTTAQQESTTPATQWPTNAEGGPAALRPEMENLRRWRASGQPRSWVEAHKGQWNHQDWLGLLETLQQSPYWPMQPDDVGRVLEEVKSAWQK
jgi:hypothetical protein